MSDHSLHTTGLLPAFSHNLDLAIPNPANATALLPLPELPTTPLSLAIAAYARTALPAPTLNHSLRVFTLNHLVIQTHLPELKIAPETLFVVSLLHDLGTTLTSSYMSFEYSGGMRAHAELLAAGAPQVLADSVAEAVIRHQDLGAGGMLTALTAVLQITTLMDNVGLRRELFSEATMKAVQEKYPRLGWSGCFGEVLKKEGEDKPWCHTTTIGVQQFRDDLNANPLVALFE